MQRDRPGLSYPASPLQPRLGPPRPRRAPHGFGGRGGLYGRRGARGRRVRDEGHGVSD